MLKAIHSKVQHGARLALHAIDKTTHLGLRSPEWHHVEVLFLHNHDECVACGGKEHLNVHHKKPFHLFPSMELEPSNLITLCMGEGRHCHLLLGHGDNFQAWNPEVERDASAARSLWAKNDDVGLEALVTKAKEQRRMGSP